MSDQKAFPADMDREVWKEYQNIKNEAHSQERAAGDHMDKGDPRDAQVHATLAVAGRLEQLAYLIARMAAY